MIGGISAFRLAQQQHEGNRGERQDHHQLEIIDVADDRSLHLDQLVERCTSAGGPRAHRMKHGAAVEGVVGRGDGDFAGLSVPTKTEHNVEGFSLFEDDNRMSPLVTAFLLFGALVVLGLIAKVAIGMWMKRQ